MPRGAADGGNGPVPADIAALTDKLRELIALRDSAAQRAHAPRPARRGGKIKPA